MTVTSTRSWQRLVEHARAIKTAHLRELMSDAARCSALTAEHDGIYLDYSRQRVTAETMELLCALAGEVGLMDQVAAMASGAHINGTEDRAALHIALRASPDESLHVDGQDVVAPVHEALRQIERFSGEVRAGARRGVTGEQLLDVISIGIGGSYLGPECAYEALRADPGCARAAQGRRLRFLANVDPVDFARATENLRPETTLAVVVSKTFTTTETMLNARAVRQWLAARLGAHAVASHMVAVSTNAGAVAAFGIDPANAFGFWDWVGGRYSVTSAVGALPLSLHYGHYYFERLLAGARSMDRHFISTEPRKNLPVLMGLLGVWNTSLLGYPARAILAYSQALSRLAAHAQQLEMESNGKRVTTGGDVLDLDAGEIIFGEPGTNSQHSFYQLLHQGRCVPAELIGFCKSQQPLMLAAERTDLHDELMANFFAQADALALGRTVEELRAQGTPERLVPHKACSGNRPSLTLLLERLDAYALGQLLALYEHRTATQGFIWGVDSFDQWGVELGKSLAADVRTSIAAARCGHLDLDGLPPSTAALLRRYVA